MPLLGSLLSPGWLHTATWNLSFVHLGAGHFHRCFIQGIAGWEVAYLLFKFSFLGGVCNFVDMKFETFVFTSLSLHVTRLAIGLLCFHYIDFVSSGNALRM